MLDVIIKESCTANSEGRPSQHAATQNPVQANSPDVIRFESRWAHHLNIIHIVMSLRPGDRNPLVCP